MAKESLSELMAMAARELSHQSNAQTTMQVAVEVSVRDIDGAEAAALSIAQRGGVVDTLASTSSEARLADELQYELGEGPCLQAVWEERVVHVPDISAETRWPRWAARASRETGYQSMMAFQLFTSGDAAGALNVYSTQLRNFDSADRDNGIALAAHISVAVRSAQHIQQLQSALDSRTVIAQAVGILMERYEMTQETAFAVLTRVSSTTNTKVRDIAAELCATGQPPGMTDKES